MSAQTVASQQLDAALTELAFVQLIREVPDDASQTAYMFKHALVQDTTLSTLLRGEYRRLNEMVAAAYEQLYSKEDRINLAPVLTQHYAAAGDAPHTVYYAALAGDQAARLYAYAETIAFYTQAIEAAKTGGATTEQFIELYTRRGRVLEVMVSTEALATYEEMYEFAQARGDRALELQALLLRGKMYSSPTVSFDHSLALDLARQANFLALELDNGTAQAQVLWNQLMLFLYSQETAAAIEVGEQALALARANGANELVAYILGDLGRAYLQSGQMEKTPAVQAEALALWRMLDNKPMLADNLMSGATNAFLHGDYDSALALAAEGAEISRAIGSRISLLSNLGTQFPILLERGEHTQVLKVADELMQVARPMNGTAALQTPLGSAIVALTYAQVGDADKAAEWARATHRVLEYPLPDFFRTWGWALLARYYMFLGDVSQALECLAAADVESELNTVTPTGLYGIPALGHAALARGDFARVIELTSNRVNRLRHFQLRQSLPELLLLQARATHALGNCADARELLLQARAEGEFAQARWSLMQIYGELARLAVECGQAQETDTYRRMTRQMIDYMQEHTPDTYQASFLNLPQVREALA